MNAHAEGEPEWHASYKVSDEYRPGFRRIEIEASSKPITPIVSARVKTQLSEGDFDPHEVGSQRSQRALWFAWVPTASSDDPPMKLLAGRAAGWPFLCMSSTRIQPEGAPSPYIRGAAPVLSASAYRTHASDPDRGALPLIPIWPGLLANTAIFAVPWLLLALTIPAARRSLRRRRGLCPRCAYDLRATPAASPCPECGQLPPSR